MAALPESKPSSPFTTAELAGWRRRLLAQRKDLLSDIAQLSAESELDESAGACDPVALPQELALEELDEARSTLLQVDRALARIDGLEMLPFGICAETGAAIERERLELMPWTSLSSRGARLRESRLT